TIGPYLLPSILPPLREAYPELPIYLQEMQTVPLLAAIEAGQTDMGLLALPFALNETLECEVLQAETFLVTCHKAHELAGKKALPPAALDRNDLLLLEDGHCLRDHALGLCALNTRAKRRDPRFQATSLTTLLHMAANGLGITLVPEMAAPEAEKLDLCLRPLTHSPIGREIALVWRKSSPRVDEIAALLAHMRPNKKGRTKARPS
ncbi:MAG: LysR substrate-binding domain-containing protein, partial [Alphaproteobacteria bacterium]